MSELTLEAPPQSPASTAVAARSDIPGHVKAAVLMVSLGPERAAEVFRHMEEEEIESLALEMAKLQAIDDSVSGSVYAELAATVTATDSALAGGVDYAREVLQRVLGHERTSEIVARLAGAIERRPFEFLRRTPAEQIVTFVRNEAPQTVALMVANLHTQLAARVLSQLPQSEQVEIALRIARMGETNPEVVKKVENVMRLKLAMVAQQDYAAAGGVKSLADILNHADRATERNVLESLSSTDEELSEEVRRLLFVFEDVAGLDDRSIQLVLRETDQKDLALALRGVPENVSQRILSNMSERGAQMLLEEMEFQPPQRKRIIEEAQGRIVAIVRRLEESGALVLSRGDGDAVV